MSSSRQFRWELPVAIVGMTVAAVCVLAFIKDPLDDEILIMNGYRVDGPADGVLSLGALTALASVFGGAGLFAIARLYRRISGPTRVDTRVFDERP